MAKMKKNIAALLILCIFSFALTGCSNEIPEMTEEQNALITEYAANLLLKYHVDYEGKLVDTSVPPVEKPMVEIPQEVVSDNTTAEEPTVSGSDVLIETTEKPEKVSLTLAQVLGVTGFEVNYRGYEVCDSYPSSDMSAEDLFFAMKAGGGNKLLVLKLDITNTSGQELLMDTLSMTDLNCKILMNENDEQRAYISMLENDFMAINRHFAADESYEAVIITEMPEEKAQAVTSVQLRLKNGERETTVGASE